MSDELTAGGGIWKRALLMLLFAVIYSIVEIVVLLVAVFQLGCVLITNRKNQRMLDLGEGLSAYVYEIFRFVTFNSERLPFPFNPWPGPGAPD